MACGAGSIAFTSLNAQSSRSHAIVMLTIAKRPVGAKTGLVEGGAKPGSRQLAHKVKVGKLFLVDLAGSERLKKSRSTGAGHRHELLSVTRMHDCSPWHRPFHR